MQLLTVALTDPLVLPLLDGLGAEYETRYGPNDVLADAGPGEFEPPDGAFVVLVQGGVTLAGGGYRRVDAGTCEVKRMWTAPGHRRRGHAQTVLSRLESLATEAGYVRIQLETGPYQPEAIAFYARKGYRRIPSYGKYGTAVAFELLLESA